MTEQKIEATSIGNHKWIWNDRESNGVGTPLIVEVEIGDEIEVQILDGTHGFATLSDKGDADPDVDEDLVMKCQEDTASKPDAVLKEIGPCIDGVSRFDFITDDTGTLIRLLVMKNFGADVHFWCSQHEEGMWGTLTLKK